MQRQRQVIPESTFVVGLCPFHKQYHNAIRINSTTGMLYFTDDIKKCCQCQPRLERTTQGPALQLHKADRR